MQRLSVVFCLSVLIACSALGESLVISEIMVQQGVSALQDEDQDAPDWIEIYNASGEAQDLTGWSLSDDTKLPRKWTFPSITLGSKSFLLVFASGKNCRDSDQPLHTNFKLSSNGEFLGLFSPEGALISGFHPEYPKLNEGVSFGLRHQVEQTITDSPSFTYHVPSSADLEGIWMHQSFDDSGWTKAEGGIGFDGNSSRILTPYIHTDVASEMRTSNSSIYLRHQFQLTSSDALMQLQVRFDDGFVLYLNGMPKIRRNAPNRVQWNSRSLGSRVSGEELIPEQIILTANDGLVPGQNTLAIQGLNTRSTDRDFLFQMEVQIWNGLDGVLGEPGYTSRPSPGAPNSEVFSEALDKPIIRATSTVSDKPIVVTLDHATPGVELRYTLDGSIPTDRSPLYEASFTVDDSAQVNVRAFHPEMAPSPVETEILLRTDSELLDFTSDIPVILLDTEGGRISASSRTRALMHLFDRGDDGRAKLSSKSDFQGLASIKVRGSSTEGRPKKAYSMEVQDIFGNDRDVSLLDMPEDSDWILYAPYNFDRALIRNAFVYELSNQLGRYAVRTRFCEVYVNSRGQAMDQRSYVGVYVLMEKIKRGADRVPIERLLRKHKDSPEVSGGYILKIDRLDPGDSGFTGGGQSLAFVEPKEDEIQADQRRYVVSYLNAMNRSLRDRDYENVVQDYEQYIDVGSWIDFHIVNEFTKNPDGFRLSTYMHLPREGRLTFGPVWDFDRTLGPDDDGRAANPVGWSSVYRFGWWGSIFRNPNFEQAYVDRWYQIRRNEMSVENMHAIIDRMADELRESQARNFRKWPLIRSTAAWQSEIRHLKNWVQQRAEWIDSQYVDAPEFMTKPGVLDEDGLVKIAPTSGRVFYTLDGSDPRLPGGARSSTALSLSRSRPEISINETTKIRLRSQVGEEWSGLVEGVFVTSEIPSIRFSEIMYHPSDPLLPSGLDEDDLEFVELINTGSFPVLMDGMQISDAISYNFGDHVIQPGEVVLIASNPEALKVQYPFIESTILGPFDGRLSNGGERVALHDGAGRLIEGIQFDDEDGWPESADGEGYSLERIDFRESGSNSWRSSFALGGTPGIVRLPGFTPSRIQFVNQSTILIEFDVEPGAGYSLSSTDNLAAPDWKTLFNWEPEDEAMVQRIELDATGSQRYFRIESR